MKSTASKTVPFKQRDEEKKMSKYFKLNTSTKVNSSKVIPYPKYRKRKKSSIKFYNTNKPLLIIAFLVLSICLISFVNNKLMVSNGTSESSKSAAFSKNNDVTISTSEYKNYNEIIAKNIHNSLKVSGNYEIQTKAMHKNGSLVYARGTIALPKEEPVYFDAILQNNNTTSLVINGVEYNK